MQLLYNSDSYAVVLFGTHGDVDTPPAQSDASAQIAAFDGSPTATGIPTLAGAHSGYEIVDKLARKEIFLQGPVAASFQRGVKALVDQGPDPQALEDYIAGFTVLAQHPVVLH
jgi:hypothetical protein